MANKIIGTVELADNAKNVTIALNGENGNMTLGGGGHDGDIVMKNRANAITVGINGQTGAVHLGGTGQDGDLLLRASNNQNTIRLDGASGQAILGGGGVGGDVTLKNSSGTTTIYLDGQTGTIRIRDWQISVPDYVFKSDYDLMEPAELCRFIDEHGHLPDVPSANHVAKEGINLTSFCMTLLRKVEELTLHCIRQNAELGELKKHIETIAPSNVFKSAHSA